MLWPTLVESKAGLAPVNILMASEYIILNELGNGAVAVKYSEIVTIELTGACASRITLSNGFAKIVAEDPCEVLRLIERTRKANEN